MKAELIKRREVYIRCPGCSDEKSHRVTDLPVGAKFGISYCASCGVGIEGYRNEEEVVIRVVDKGKDVSYILVRVNPGETPVFLMVRPIGETSNTFLDLRQIVSIRYDDRPETFNAIKYVVLRTLDEPDDSRK